MMKSVLAGLGLALVAAVPAAAASDGPTIYVYPSAVNYCPTGLQPIALNGVICCGVPTTTQTWDQVMRHPATSSRRASYPADATTVERIPLGKGLGD